MQGQLLPEDSKRCPGCDREKPVSEFRSNCTWCRSCYRFLDAMRRGVPYETLLSEQDGVCALCGDVPKGGRLNIDHLHVPPDDRDGFVYVRGLLCGPCNRLVGSIEQRPQVMDRVMSYLAAEPRRFYLPTARTKRRSRPHGPRSSWNTADKKL